MNANREVRTLSKVVGRILNPVVGYLLVLLGFAFLGLFVAALAMRSEFAGILGIALTASFGLAVPAFRNCSATLAAAREAGIIGDIASIWAATSPRTDRRLSLDLPPGAPREGGYSAGCLATHAEAPTRPGADSLIGIASRVE